MANYDVSYLGQLRKLVGNLTLISIGTRAILQDEQGRVLLIRRADNGMWAMPAGSMELGESVLDCLKREVFEETGLIVLEATPIAIYSEPRFAFNTAYGDPYQMFAVVFRVDKWQGDLHSKTDETVDARFFALDDLPENLHTFYCETLDDLQKFDGRLILK
jgi:ADP-ribose pyrophosphatase YjhB (NUDIX family)